MARRWKLRSRCKFGISKDGDMVRYKKSDFKYDAKAGFLRF